MLDDERRIGVNRSERLRLAGFLAADDVRRTLGLSRAQSQIVREIFATYIASELPEQKQSFEGLSPEDLRNHTPLTEERLSQAELALATGIVSRPLIPLERYEKLLRQELTSGRYQGAGGGASNGSADLKSLDVIAIALSLTPRERQVLELVAQGKTDKEMGGILSVSHHTVKNHVVSVMEKGRFGTRTQAAVFLARAGFRVTPDDKERPSITEITQR